MARITVAAADALLDVVHPVLDKGHIVLMDYFGGDASIVSAARTSYAGGTKTVREDAGLINYLIKNDHGSPLEMCDLQMHIKLPLFAMAQLVRHRHASLNSASARYSVMSDEFYVPAPDQWRAQSGRNKQVGEGHVNNAVGVAHSFAMECQQGYEEYERMLEAGVAREQARMILPQNLYTEIVWKINLRSLFNFLKLRLDWHAQAEIRAYAEAMVPLVKAVAPLAYAAFEEHVLGAVKLSKSEFDALPMSVRDAVIG